MPLKKEYFFYTFFIIFSACISLGIIIQCDYLFSYYGKFFSQSRISVFYIMLGEIVYSLIFSFVFLFLMYIETKKNKLFYVPCVLIFMVLIFNITYNFSTYSFDILLIVSMAVSIVFLVLSNNIMSKFLAVIKEYPKDCFLITITLIYANIFVISNILYFEWIKTYLNKNYAKDGLSLFIFGLSSLITTADVFINRNKIDEENIM